MLSHTQLSLNVVREPTCQLSRELYQGGSLRIYQGGNFQTFSNPKPAAKLMVLISEGNFQSVSWEDDQTKVVSLSFQQHKIWTSWLQF